MQNTNLSGNSSRKIDLQRIVVLAECVLRRSGGQYSVFFSRDFRKFSTVVTLLDSFYYFCFIAIGVTFCLISGGNDLSVGTGMRAATIVDRWFLHHQAWPPDMGGYTGYHCLRADLRCAERIPGFCYESSGIHRNALHHADNARPRLGRLRRSGKLAGTLVPNSAGSAISQADGCKLRREENAGCPWVLYRLFWQ